LVHASKLPRLPTGENMNGFKGNMASGAFEKPERGDTLLSLTSSQRMVPLVSRIVRDILVVRGELVRLVPEQEALDRKRHSLPWPDRSRRYRLQEEIAAAERSLDQSLAELDHLGVVLVNPEAGMVGFPTVVNGRKAFFSWKPGEETLTYWHFSGETVRRMIPASWSKVDDVSLSGRA